MSNKKVIFGVIIIAFGLLLMSRKLGLYYFSFGDLFGSLLPLGLIALGIWFIVKKRHNGSSSVNVSPDYNFSSTSDAHGAEAGTSNSFQNRAGDFPESHPSGKLKYSKVFGDMHIECTGMSLQDVEASMFMGDIEIKLHGGKLVTGLNRMVISGFIGDLRILVPKDIPVCVQCSNFIGDITLFEQKVNGFGNNLNAQTPTYSEATSKLYIATNSFIGDVHVYYV